MQDCIDLVISQTQAVVGTLHDEVDGIDMCISQTQIDPSLANDYLDQDQQDIIDHEKKWGGNEEQMNSMIIDENDPILLDDKQEEVLTEKSGAHSPTAPLAKAETASSPWIEANKVTGGDRGATSMLPSLDQEQEENANKEAIPSNIPPADVNRTENNGLTFQPKRLFQSFAVKDNPPLAAPVPSPDKKDTVKPVMNKFRRKLAGLPPSAEKPSKTSNEFAFTSWTDDADEVDLQKQDEHLPAIKRARLDQEEEFDDDIVSKPNVRKSNSSNGSKTKQAVIASPLVSPKPSLSSSLPTNAFNLPPRYVSLKSVPSVWTALWSDLEEAGWTWSKGRGLVDFYYLRPEAKPTKEYTVGIDYFTSQGDVERYVKMSVQKISGESIESKGIKEGKESKGSVKESKEGKKESKKGSKDTKDSALDMDSEEEYRTEVKRLKLKKSSEKKESTAEEESQLDIRTVPWKDLWHVLRDLGWTWEFGPSLFNYYYAPGFSSKNDKKAVEGVGKFRNEEEVRKMIKREMREGGEKREKWLMFRYDKEKRGSVEGSRKSSEGEGSRGAEGEEYSQLEQEGERGDWVLAKDRKKRPYTLAIAESSAQDNNYLSSSHAPAQRNNNSTKPPHSAKKREERREQSKEELTQVQYSPLRARKSNNSNNLVSLSGGETPLSSPVKRVGGKGRGGESSPQKRESNLALLHQIQREKNHERGGERGEAEERRRRVFSGYLFLFSGIEQNIKERLSQGLERLGGEVVACDKLTELKERVEREQRAGQRVLLLSQPQDFRKPKYIISCILGVELVHYLWALRCIEEEKVVRREEYSLPSTYSPLHSYYLFGEKEKQKERGSILQGIRVLNLTGNPTWDELLLCAGALMVPCEERLLQKLLQKQSAHFLSHPSLTAAGERGGGGGGGGGVEVDLLLFDTAVYVRTTLLRSHNNNSTNNNGKKSPKRDKKPLLSSLAMDTLKHCQALYKEVLSLSARHRIEGDWPPLVASTEWLTHCLAVRQFTNIRTIDLFSLPEQPEHKPMCYKGDLEIGDDTGGAAGGAGAGGAGGAGGGGGGGGGGGERFCKYDFVSFSQGAGKEREKVGIGKILGFSRRGVDFPLLVRVREAEVQERGGGGREIVPIPFSERVIPAKQLLKKVVVYRKEEYIEKRGYTSSQEERDLVYVSQKTLEEEWSEVKLEEAAEGEEEEEEEEGTGRRGQHYSQDL